jgi:hypothetical protein
MMKYFLVYEEIQKNLLSRHTHGTVVTRLVALLWRCFTFEEISEWIVYKSGKSSLQ